MKTLLAVMLLGAGPAAGLAAQASAAARLQGRVPAAAAETVLQLADSAARAGLPPEPLLRKALEGGAKGVPAERIVAAVRQVAARLGEAAGDLRASGVSPDAETVEAGGYALNAGLSPEDVRRVISANHPPHPLAATLRSAGTLAALGVPSAEVAELVSAWIRSGHSPGQVLDLPQMVEAAMAHGATPAQAAAGMAHGNNGQGPPANRPGPPPQSQGHPHKP